MKEEKTTETAKSDTVPSNEEKIDLAAAKILELYQKAFEELAK